MSVSPRVVATQGVGYGTLLVAVQGLLGVQQAAQPDDPSNGPGIPTRRRARRVWTSLAPAPYFEDDEDEVALAMLGMV